MKRTRAALIVSLLAVLALGPFAPARANDAAVRKELEAIYAEYHQAYKARDATPLRHWFERYLAPEVTETEVDGSKLNRQQVIDRVKKLQKTWLPAREVRGKIEALTVHGEEAIALISERAVCILPDREAATDPRRPPHELVLVSSERDTWRKTPVGWRCTRSVDLTGTATLDGKPLPVPGAVKPNKRPKDEKPNKEP